MCDCCLVEGAPWSTVVGTDEGYAPPVSRLCQSYPNPFNAHCTIPYDISVGCTASLRILNVRGAVVRTLLDGSREPGGYSEVWDGCDDAGKQVPSGVYLLRLEVGNSGDVRKIVMLR